MLSKARLTKNLGLKESMPAKEGQLFLEKNLIVMKKFPDISQMAKIS